MYLGIWCSRAFQETSKYWTVQRILIAFASPVITVPIRECFQASWNRGDIVTTAAVTIAVVSLLWAITFAVEFFRSPGLLHAEQQQDQFRRETEFPKERIALESEVRKERLLRESEEARNSKPDLKGKAFDFRQYGLTGNRFGSMSIGFVFTLDLSNHGLAITNLSNIVLDGSTLNPVVQFSQYVLGPPVELPFVQFSQCVLLGPPVEFPRGIRKTANILSEATIAVSRETAALEIDLTGLILDVVDAFGSPHRITIRGGEKLVF